MTTPFTASVYPARLQVDHPEQRNRVTTLFRVFLVIPIAIVQAYAFLLVTDRYPPFSLT